MVIICNKEKVEGLSFQTWNRVLSARAKEILLDCLEAGLEAYDDEDLDNDTSDACQDLKDLIRLLQE